MKKDTIESQQCGKGTPHHNHNWMDARTTWYCDGGPAMKSTVDPENWPQKECDDVLTQPHDAHRWAGVEVIPSGRVTHIFFCPGFIATLATTETELADWWRSKAQDEIKATVAKAVEYGATDLEDIGHQLARISGRQVSDAEAAEIGIAFYALGKVSRIMAAIKEGRRPSQDSWHDLGIYARMAQRVIEHGRWP